MVFKIDICSGEQVGVETVEREKGIGQNLFYAKMKSNKMSCYEHTYVV